MRSRRVSDIPRDAFLQFVRAQTRARRAADQPPKSLDEWTARKAAIRKRLAAAYGDFPAQPCELEPHVFGVLERGGYRIERLMFQSRPGIWVTANAYVPTGAAGKRPAVLSVHGHWPWARVDPVPHARAVGLVKLGYFVFAVDAFGAGERAIEPARGTYHGALLGASTWPVGTPLLGLQIYDNMRAVDYMTTRAEVDPDKLAITGASGGGNQSMNAGAWDERFKAVVPVCSVGTYDAYLGAACCVCEMLPGAIGFIEEGDLLAMVAPRALLVINASRDGHQFSIGEAAKSIARARPTFELFDAGEKIKHATFESGHDYSRPMREAMYGWLARWLKGEGDGSPIDEPELKIEEIDDLRCFPQNVRPKSFTLLPAFVQTQAKRKIAKLPAADHRERWESDALLARTRLEREIFGGFPRSVPATVEAGEKFDADGLRGERFVFYPEPNMPLPAVLVRGVDADGVLPTAVLVDPAGRDAALETPLARDLLGAGWQLLALDLRATGATAIEHDAIAGVPDHNSCEWAIWMGRPLLGQWCWDIIRAVEHLLSRGDEVDPRQIALVGTGAGGLAAICAAALEDRIHAVATIRTLASFASPNPFRGHRMATFVPFLLDIGDVPQLAALVAPRRLVMIEPVDAESKSLDADALDTAFISTATVFKWFQPEGHFRVADHMPGAILAEALRGA